MNTQAFADSPLYATAVRVATTVSPQAVGITYRSGKQHVRRSANATSFVAYHSHY